MTSREVNALWIGSSATCGLLMAAGGHWLPAGLSACAFAINVAAYFIDAPRQPGAAA